ncbi:hypothetical protein GDO78_022137 [Eleutherodactylus coqui]|uniref:Uncharacterized protein n=2 Tax=Eleutherodactylus coqui TaxID=57060 RepID=A0A8J6EGN8_ELECQ|nr:hypothetical protein GDO78_022137 [Eleutherodactylus coqui]
MTSLSCVFTDVDRRFCFGGCKSLGIMPCCHEMVKSPSTCEICAIIRKNGVHKHPGKITNEEFTNAVVHSSIPEPCAVARISDLVQLLQENPKNLEAVSTFVQDNKDKSIEFESSDYYLRLCDLNGTIHMGQTFMQEGWEQLYLPKETKMQVLGTLESRQVWQPSVEWIVLVGEDGCIYAYEEEEMQLIARSMSEFVKDGKGKVYSSYNYPDSDSEVGCDSDICHSF